jgi:hypothetical protein
MVTIRRAIWSATMLLAAILPSPGDAATGRLSWNPNTGAVLETPAATVCLDRNEKVAAPELRFLPDGGRQLLDRPDTNESSPTGLKLTYRATAPGGVTIDVLRTIAVSEDGSGFAAVETFTLRPARPLAVDVEIQRPFAIYPKQAGARTEVAYPLRSGLAKRVSLAEQSVAVEYRLGHFLTQGETTHLALPVIQLSGVGGGTAVWMADPTFSSLWEVSGHAKSVAGIIRYRYAGSRVPLAREETRQFGFWLPPTDVRRGSPTPPKRPTECLPSESAVASDSFPAAVDAFYEHMLADVPPGPKWLHEVAMVGYDYLSDGGKGWDRDVGRLAEWLTPQERRRVALCLHGWYDAIGPYCFDASSRRLRDEWVAFGPTRKIALTTAEMKRRMRLARELGFRVLLYFGDGLACDSGAPGYRDAWIYRDAQGQPIRGWQGPDTFGPTYWLNPAHPEVAAWFLDYLQALLDTYNAEVDGFVWDETFECKIGQIAAQPEPAYCDRAMFRLVKQLAARVHAFDREKVFLASDCQGVFRDVPGYAMVAHGTYQDTGCNPGAWPWGLFSNWRNVLWSCNWAAVTGFQNTRYGVETFGVPVAISNGWGDDRGPAEWTAKERDEILELFRRRLQQKERVRYLTTDPLAAMQGDPLPVAEEGLVNWASAARGSRATASSEDAPRYPAAGVIDGVREERGWGTGHGWASQAQPRPHWLQVTFSQPRPIRRFVVITYHHDDGINTAQMWGVRDYEIQVRDGRADAWKTVVTESQGRAVKVRVHNLPQPVEAAAFRILIHHPTPFDARARLLQLEAWGPEGK